MTNKKHNPLREEKFYEILDKLKTVKIGLIGDGCVDIYWSADMTKSELSKETPHYPLPVVEEKFSLGAGANVAANINALGVKKLHFVTCVGNDWRKEIFYKLLAASGISDKDIIIDENRITPAYCKTLRKGISNVIYEDPRIDFEEFEILEKKTENKIIEGILSIVKDCDVLAVSDQFLCGCVTKNIRSVISEIAKTKIVVVDSRNNVGLYQNVIVKPNELECGKLLNMVVGEKTFALAAKNLYTLTQHTSLITLGEYGALWIEKNSFVLIPSKKIAPPIDIVGAGDAFFAGFCCALATGSSGEEAVEIGNLVSSITIKKINMTGTATVDELRFQFKQHSAKMEQL